MQVSVRDNNVDQALRALKKKLQREGVFREMKLRQHFEKPSEKKAREKAEAISPGPQAGAQESPTRRPSLRPAPQRRDMKNTKSQTTPGHPLRGFVISGTRIIPFGAHPDVVKPAQNNV